MRGVSVSGDQSAASSSSIGKEPMLRVEASNLPKPRGTPRARRLLPNPPMPRRVATSRHEILPPPDQASPPDTELTLPRPQTRVATRERWSVKLELGDEEIAKLYGQGLTRGAVVWKKGMVEWRPLLITPELSGLLHRTRITLTDSTDTNPQTLQTMVAPAVVDEVTLPKLPRPSRLPEELLPDAERPVIPTVAPTAMDVEAPTKPRRPLELLAVGVAAFTLAWIGHATLHPAGSGAAAPPPAQTTRAPAAAACEPSKSSVSSSVLASAGMPTISVTDLPLLGSSQHAAASTRGRSSRVGSRSTAPRDGGPSRADLQAALSQVASAASGCGERGGPVRVVVSFANSGVARSIQVSGADLPSATRSCMIGAASRARVPAFSGDPVTVAKTL
jgi:hypothetical protein